MSPRSVKLTKAQKDTLRELANNVGKNWCYWARPASCRQLEGYGFAEKYTPPSVLERPRMTTRPYRITPAGLQALKTHKEGENG